jgi:hypothetical protein
MVRKTVSDRGVEFVVIWDGAWNSKSLLGNIPRPSALAGLVPDRTQPESSHYVSRKGRDGARVIGRRGKRDPV